MTQQSNTALLIIDIQNDYFPGGKCELVGPEQAALMAGKLLQHFRTEQMPVVHIQHLMPPERKVPFLVEGTTGSEIHESVKPREGETVIQKRFPNAFQHTALHEHLQRHEIKNLVVCGMMTHMCVSATSRIAMELGYQVTIVEDATATRDLLLLGERIPADLVHRGNLAALHGTVANVVGIDAFLQNKGEPMKV